MQWKTNGNNADTNFFIGTINQRDLKFKTNDTEHIRIKKEGNVGIGTMNPQEKLHVRGSVKIDSVLTARSLDILKNSNYQGNAIFQRRLGVAGLTTLDSVTINGPLKLTNVQEVSDDLQNFEVIIRETENGLIKKGGQDAMRDFIYGGTTQQFEFCQYLIGLDGNPIIPNPVWENGPSKIFVKCPDNVKVGIGTTNPRVKLDVLGDFYSQKIAIGNINPTNMVGYFHLRHPSTPSNINATVLLVENSTRKLMQLDNTGLLYAREIKVNLDAWPDYVFEQNYSLFPLEQLADYINQNKHLPGVPSACEMEEKGVNVAETSTMLMEKVEELTLYMIQLQVQLQEQEIQLKVQQSLIRDLQNK